MMTWQLETPESRLKEPHLGYSEDPPIDIPCDHLQGVHDHGRSSGTTRTRALRPEQGTETLPRPIPRGVDLAAIEARLSVLSLSPTTLSAIADPKSLATHELHRRNIACGHDAACLAGELSIAAAICAGEFTQAHERLARRTADSFPAR